MFMPHISRTRGSPAKEVPMLVSVPRISLKGRMPCGTVIVGHFPGECGNSIWHGITLISSYLPERCEHREDMTVMKTTYEIRPILTCKINLDKGSFTYLKNYGQRALAPVWAWLITGGEKAVLVDAGSSLTEFMKYSILSSGGEEGVPLEDSLQKVGVPASDISIVVMTHLHSDHCLNARKFPQAKIVVQRRELDFALNPHPLFAPNYKKEWYEGLQFETVDGDTELLPGIEVLLTPGHTAGCQSVSVLTQRGRAVIAGFCALDDNFADKGDTIPGIHVDALACYDSMIKIRKMADSIIPLHSERALHVKSYS
jgi:N-acyl homoserine lactone hydrolase